jgi:hypothetical protein
MFSTGKGRKVLSGNESVWPSLSKYISKAISLESFTGRQRYRYSKHIEIVKRSFYLPYANVSEAYLIKELISEYSTGY